MNKSDLPIRINKYLSEIGFCSRREADKLIKEGRVFVNGKLIEMGLKIILLIVTIGYTLHKWLELKDKK